MTRDALEGKVAIVTGAGRGIGRETAIRLAAEGARVVVAEIDAETGRETTEHIRRERGEALYVETDVTEPESVERLVRETVQAYGRVDVLHNNAGGSTERDGLVTEVPLEEWWRTIRVDLFGTFLGCRYGIAEMMRGGGGSVINMASLVALRGIAGRHAYTAAKGGIVSLTRGLAAGYARHRVRVNAIAPGGVATERILAMMGDRAETLLAEGAGIPSIGRPSDIADLVVFLASDRSRLITGAIIPVDSGASATTSVG